MNPYSHLVLASRLEDFVGPANTSEYYWGSIAADIRYMAGFKREQTHIPVEKILESISTYPQLKSFLQGYLVHCLCDEIDLGDVFCRQLMFAMLKKRFSRQHYAVMLELYCLEKEKVCQEIIGTYNPLLAEMGIEQSLVKKYGEAMNRYQGDCTSDSQMQELFILMGLQGDARIDKYIQAARSIQRNKLLKGIFFLSIGTGKILDTLSRMVEVNPCWSDV